ncbi:MAG TPA: EscU/YscU/HrcU family type III secretion system export apparatus switch protein, partial [Burkholderiaceae bacterium]
MAESEQAQDRTLDPSAKRLEDARREGHVPRSRDLAHLFVVGSSAAVLLMTGGSLAGACRRLVER